MEKGKDVFGLKIKYYEESRTAIRHDYKELKQNGRNHLEVKERQFKHLMNRISKRSRRI